MRDLPLSSTRAALALTVAAGSALTLSACTKSTVIAEPPPAAYVAPEPVELVMRPLTERITGGSASAASDGPQVVSRRRFDAPKAEARAQGEAQGQPPVAEQTIKVQYSAKSAEVADVLNVLLKQYLDQDYVLDPRVTGQVTLEIDAELTRREISDLVGMLASAFNWTLDRDGGVVMVRQGAALPRAAGAPVLDGAPAFASDQPSIGVRRLRYAPAEQTATLMRDMTSEGGKILVAGRVLVMADTTRQVARLSRLVDAVDVPAFDGVEVWTYRLAHRRPEDAAKILEQIATGTAVNSSADPQVGFVALPGTRRLMVFAKDSSLQPLVYDLIREVDQPSDSEQRQRYVYRVQHYNQAALLKLLQDFFGDKVETVGGGGAATAGASDVRMRLVADPQSDVILIHATPADYTEVLATLRVLDKPPQQVAIQSIIAEVRLTNALQWGVEYFLENETSLGELALTGAAPLTAGSVATGSAFFIGGDGFAVIQALDRESSTRILSQPRLVVADRAKGSIQVGGEVPTIRASEGSQTQVDGSTGIRQEIEYRDTGVILNLEPQISESGTITLKITQDVRDSIPTTIPNQPEFTTRKIETTVIVPHGKTVLLGGIINEDNRTGANRIPLLGRIPVLGEAFSNKSDESERTELLLAITPRIVSEPADLALLNNQFVQSVVGIRALMHEFSADLPAGALHDLAPPRPENPETVVPGPVPVDPPTNLPEAAGAGS